MNVARVGHYTGTVAGLSCGVSEHTQRPRRRFHPRARSGSGSFPLGRIAGIRIGVHWSVLVIFGLLAYLLAGERFPRAYEGFSTAAYIAAGLLAAVVFFLSLLAHEISHALVARRNGQQVEGITLWLFGGVARLHGEARNPGAELRVAGVGPLVSLLLGLAFGGVAALLGIAGVGQLIVGAVSWLGIINVALAIFNSVPAAPLDGGRLLRAFLWWRTGDPTKAAVWASRAGQAFGWFLVAGGLLWVLYGDFSGLWLALVGWFLVSVASAEGQQAAVRGRLAGVPVWQVMTPDPVTAPAAMTVQEFLDSYLMRHRHSAFPIAGDEGQPLGLVTFNRSKEVPPEERGRTRLADVALPLAEVIRVTPEAAVSELLPRLGSEPEARALVFAGERLAGIVSPRDLSRTLERVSRSRWPAGG